VPSGFSFQSAIRVAKCSSPYRPICCHWREVGKDPSGVPCLHRRASRVLQLAPLTRGDRTNPTQAISNRSSLPARDGRGMDRRLLQRPRPENGETPLWERGLCEPPVRIELTTFSLPCAHEGAVWPPARSVLAAKRDDRRTPTGADRRIVAITWAINSHEVAPRLAVRLSAVRSKDLTVF
jgi:hypothetical protein